MRDLAALTEQIRAVRDAQRQFMSRWRMEVLVGPEVLDRLAADMAAAHRELDEDGDSTSSCDRNFPRELDSSRLDYSGPRSWSMFNDGGAADAA